jgi:hypothetical protein
MIPKVLQQYKYFSPGSTKLNSYPFLLEYCFITRTSMIRGSLLFPANGSRNPALSESELSVGMSSRTLMRLSFFSSFSQFK